MERINAPKLWERGLTGKGIVVAVIDSGANVLHPDLMPNVWRNLGESGMDANGRDKSNNGIDDDKNGFVDDVIGWNFEDGNHDLTDRQGHGSQAAGIIAGSGAGGLHTGVAPDAKVMIVRSCCSSNNEIFESRNWEAIQYALQNGADVISMSITLKHYTKPSYASWRRLGEVLLTAGILHVNSAGNRGSGEEPHNIGAPASNPPAWFHPDQVSGTPSSMISVGATNRR